MYASIKFFTYVTFVIFNFIIFNVNLTFDALRNKFYFVEFYRVILIINYI